MTIRDEIRARLEAAFQPHSLEVRDDSERHRGHAGWREGGETHFNVKLTADRFGSMSRLERHRAVHDALGADLIGRIHALSLHVGG